jgi:uncharacterized Zn finger protein (UPF0148 family)
MPDDETTQEERHAKRYRLKNFKLRYVDDNLFSFIKRSKGAEQALINMSATGLAFLAPESLPTGSPLKIIIADSEGVFPGDFALKGRIVYCHQVGRQSLYRVGVHFTEQAGAAAEMLDYFDELVGALKMRVLCPHCGTAIKVKKKHEGRMTPCPNCKTPVKLVEEGEEKTAAQPPAEPVAAEEAPAAEEQPPAQARPAPGRRLDPKLAKLVKTLFPSKTALHVFDIVTDPARHETNEIATARLAREVSAPAYRVGTALKKLEEHGILRLKQSGVFAYEPSEAGKAQVEELRNALADDEVRAQVESGLK